MNGDPEVHAMVVVEPFEEGGCHLCATLYQVDVQIFLMIVSHEQLSA